MRLESKGHCVALSSVLCKTLKTSYRKPLSALLLLSASLKATPALSVQVCETFPGFNSILCDDAARNMPTEPPASVYR
jgi:hypothetical protein